MSEERPDTRELRETQSQREVEEQALARSATEEPETATHARRAEKAEYLRKKLEERARSEREKTGKASSADQEAAGDEGEE